MYIVRIETVNGERRLYRFYGFCMVDVVSSIIECPIYYGLNDIGDISSITFIKITKSVSRMR